MRKLAMTALALALIGSFATPATAGNLVLQFLGAADLEGTGSNLCEIDAREGTNIDFAALDQAFPPVGTTFPAGSGCESYFCFEMPLIDPETGLQMGTGLDCLRWEDGTAPGPDAFTVTAVSFFSLPAGTLAIAGRTTVEPFVDGFGNGGDPARTHLTGSVAAPGSNSVVGGTGPFANRMGTGRVSGALSLGSDVVFDCLWVLDLNNIPGSMRDRGSRLRQ